MKVDSYIGIRDHSVINLCMHEYSGDTRGVVLDMLYYNVIMRGVCNSQLNIEQSHILFEFVIMCGVCSSQLNIEKYKPYYTSNNLTFYLNL